MDPWLELLTQHQLDHRSEEIGRCVLLGVRLRATPTSDEELPVGCSKLGGDADVPPDFVWPINHGWPLSLVAQIDLADMPEHELVQMFLPREGLLSFFYDLGNQPWGYSPEHVTASRIHYTPPGVGLVRTPVPHASAEVERPIYADFSMSPCRVELELALTLASPDSPYVRAMFLGGAFSDDEQDRYDRLYEEAMIDEDGPPQHQVLGHPLPVQGEMDSEAVLVGNGVDCGGTNPQDPEAVRQILTTRPNWVHLLQIDTDDDAGIMWGDCGKIYFWAEAPCVQARTFDRSLVILQCS